MPIDLSILPRKLANVVAGLSSKYKFESINDKGGNGYVLIGTNIIIDRKVVVKFYYWGDGVHAEPKTLSSLASPHVLRVEDAAAIDNEDAYFVTPFCSQGDLDDLMSHKKIGLLQAIDYLQQVATGASFIHGAGYVHRDLKPSNVFCDADGKLVIGDFGSVVKIGEHGYAKTGSKHSLIYRTPEEIKTSQAYPAGDIYQLGIVLYQLLGGYLSYSLEDWLSAKEKLEYNKRMEPENQFYANGLIEDRIQRGRVLDFSTLPGWCPRQIETIIRKCTKLDHKRRFESIADLKAKLSNIRPSLPDWRLEPEPVLYRAKYRLRIVEQGKEFAVEKSVNNGAGWRRVHAIQPSPLRTAVEAAEKI